MEHRRNSLDKAGLESGEKGFVADIKFPGDLPLPTHDLCQKGAHGGHRKSIDLTADVISHDKIVRKSDQIVSLGAVDGADNIDNMHGFQKDITMGAANTERPAHVTRQGSLKPDTEIEVEHPLDTIPEVSEKKGLVTLAVETVAAAAGTVAGIFSSSSKSSANDEVSTAEGQPDNNAPEEQEKGLVDSALEKVWNVLTGKEELFPEAQPATASAATAQDQAAAKAELENFQYNHQTPHQQLNADAPVFVPHGLVSQQNFPPQFVPAEVLMQQQQGMTPEQWALQQQQQLAAAQAAHLAMQNQQAFVQGHPQPQFLHGQQPHFGSFNNQQTGPGLANSSYQFEQTTIAPVGPNSQSFQQQQ